MDMIPFVSYWYLQSPQRFYSAYLSLLNGLEAQLAVVDMVRNISKPLFQDYTFQGRLIGVAIRVLRIIGSVFIYAVISLAYAAIYLFWLLFPILCLLSLVGSLVGPSNPTIILQ